jgi:organic hydroperoxide reductase OsmC/OhrA
MATPRTRTHTYTTVVTWTGDQGTGTSGYRDYTRDHDVAAEGRPVILGSSEPLFRGDPSRWNPELLLVASLSQCHMLWYLHLASEAKVVVTGYVDEAVGTMTEEPGGAGRFTSVTLRPRITVTSPEMVDVARSLHERAHALCFIAQSVNFPVTVTGQISQGT